jgi:hypothetical protein
MVPWTGSWCPVRNYCPGKPHKYGLKIWEIVGDNLNWLLDFYVEAAKGDRFSLETDEEREQWTFAERLVLWGMKRIPEFSYMTCDRYFTSPAVAAYCKKVLKSI